MSVFTGRYLAVVKGATVRDAANRVMLRLDPDGGSSTFTVPLRRVGGTTAVAWWASMVVTPEQAAFLDDRIKNEAAVAKAVIEPGETPTAWTTGKVWLFRADEALDNRWTPDAVLTALGLVVFDTTV